MVGYVSFSLFEIGISNKVKVSNFISFYMYNSSVNNLFYISLVHVVLYIRLKCYAWPCTVAPHFDVTCSNNLVFGTFKFTLLCKVPTTQPRSRLIVIFCCMSKFITWTKRVFFFRFWFINAFVVLGNNFKTH